MAELTSRFSVELGFPFNIHLGEELERFRNATLFQDFDCSGIVDGAEGAGKSVFGMQLGVFLDRERRLIAEKQLCWDPGKLPEMARALRAEFGVGKVLIFDEARRGTNRRRSMDDINLRLGDFLAEVRQLNLFFLFVLPSFYDQDMYFSMWRTRFLTHVWYEMSDDNPLKPLKRGFFRFYNESGKKNLFTNDFLRKGYNYPLLKGMSFDGTFPGHYVVPEDEYRGLKAASLSDYKAKVVSKTECPICGSGETRFSKKDSKMSCRRCGVEWVKIG